MKLEHLLSSGRSHKNMTLRSLSLETGIDSALLSKYERGERSPSEKHLLVLIAHLELDSLEAKAVWLGERVYSLFEGEERLFEKAMSVAEERIEYIRKKATDQEENLSERITDLIKSCNELKEHWGKLKPLNAIQLEKMEAYFKLNYTYESNRIEGNTLTLQETHLVINDGITVGGKSMREHLEVINHAEAIEYLTELVKNNTPFTERILKQIHYLILKGIDRENAGVYRAIGVRISGSTYIPPEPYLLHSMMEEVFRYYQEQRQILHPVILASEMHERIVRIHPFVDGNGRTSRLVMNLILMQNGYPIANIKGETANRLRYYTALENALSDGKQSFHELILETVRASLTEHIQLSR